MVGLQQNDLVEAVDAANCHPVAAFVSVLWVQKKDPVTGGEDAGLVGPMPILAVNFLLLLACLLAFSHAVRTYIHMVRSRHACCQYVCCFLAHASFCSATSLCMPLFARLWPSLSHDKEDIPCQAALGLGQMFRRHV